LDGAVVGVARADLIRADLIRADQIEAPAETDAALAMLPSLSQHAESLAPAAGDPTDARMAFIILFDSPVALGDLARIEVRTIDDDAKLQHSGEFRSAVSPPQQIFILGSPRSGTSELAATLAGVLELPWLGEGHAGPAFKKAADSLSGDANSNNELLRFMATQSFRGIAKTAMRRAYYYLHSSASFIDKTSGIDMINAAPFLAECFPDAKFIYLRRNGISNVLSRMAKFGGRFDEHCADWAAAMTMWDDIKELLPHYLEVEQELMQDFPDIIAMSVATYLHAKPAEREIVASLRTGSRERTGAGFGQTTLASTGWNETEKTIFRATCGKVMQRHGYPMD
jgi:hypothetical protein